MLLYAISAFLHSDKSNKDKILQLVYVNKTQTRIAEWIIERQIIFQDCCPLLSFRPSLCVLK